MSQLPELRAGVYRHYKGPLYLVLGYGHDANNERTVVVYIGLELDGAKEGARLAVRTVQDFFATVHEDGAVCFADECQLHGCDDCTQHVADVKHVPRFAYVGPTWAGVR